jgi:NAD(P)-dependent dehydrogenase (short-subunit alcohol dehydrogenase family)
MLGAMPNENAVALVTGGAKRVGRAVVLRLAELGYDVAFTYLSSAAEAADVRRAAEAFGVRAVADPGRPVRPAGRGRGDRPGGDRLVGPAGRAGQQRQPLAARPAGRHVADVTRKVWAVHVESPLLLCQRFAGRLRQARGHVVNMVDLLAERPWPEYLAYCASKAACGT